MRILVLDDHPAVLHSLVEMLEEQGHAVLACNDVASATYCISEQEKIDCFIVDLSMAPRGLAEEQALRSQGGILTGWIWLVDNVINRNNDAICIIFSDYTDYLMQYLLDKPDEQRILQNVTVIAKSDIDFIVHLNNAVKGIVEKKYVSDDVCKSIFLSFCSRDCDIADIVEQRLQQHFCSEIIISRWERDVKYKGSFKEFMDSMKDHDYILSIISDHYLKSRPCMYEVGRIIDEPSFQKKLIFIVLSDDDKQYYQANQIDSIAANVYDLASHFNYISYWKNEYDSLNRQINEIGIYIVSPELASSVNETKKILDDIQKFMSYIYDARGIPFSELMETNFQVIKDTINDYG